MKYPIYFSRNNAIAEWNLLGQCNISIKEIASNLSNICRFNGATGSFYSVAEHSVLVSNLCSQFQKEALLHDASEAFTGDIVRPVRVFMITELSDLISKINSLIDKKYHVKIEKSQDVWKIVDNLVMDIEIAHFFNGAKSSLIQCLHPIDAFELFIDRWDELNR